MILTAFRREPRYRNIHALYGMIVAQARLPAFYVGHGVPDTVDGRFELIVMHLVLVLDRLGRDREKSSPNGQRLFDAFCRDLDDNLREMGVGDMAVPRRMRSFGEAFYGRQAAYRAALSAADERDLEKAISRNIFGIAGVDDKAVPLARYMRAAARQLDAQEEDLVAAGKAVFPDPEAFFRA